MRRVFANWFARFGRTKRGQISWTLDQQAVRLMTNERHGNSILNTGPHVFTLGWMAKKLAKRLRFCAQNSGMSQSFGISYFWTDRFCPRSPFEVRLVLTGSLIFYLRTPNWGNFFGAHGAWGLGWKPRRKPFHFARRRRALPPRRFSPSEPGKSRLRFLLWSVITWTLVSFVRRSWGCLPIIGTIPSAKRLCRRYQWIYEYWRNRS